MEPEQRECHNDGLRWLRGFRGEEGEEEDIDWHLPVEQEELWFGFKEVNDQRTRPKVERYRKRLLAQAA